MRVITDERLNDEQVLLYSIHRDHARALRATLSAALTPSILTALSQVRHLPKNDMRVSLSVSSGISMVDLHVLPVIEQSILNLLDDFLFSLVESPRSVSSDRSHLHLPVSRFIALNTFDVELHSFKSPPKMAACLIHLQWAMRSIVLAHWHRTRPTAGVPIQEHNQHNEAEQEANVESVYYLHDFS
jgi:hypothetical protein